MTTGETSSAAANSDADQDGIPDNPFFTLTSDKTLWLAEVSDQTTGRRKTIVARRWDEPARDAKDPLSIDLDLIRQDGTPQSISLTVPRELIEPGETGVVLLSVAPDPVTLLGAKEASLLAPEPEGVLMTGAQYVEVSVLVSSDKGATYTELDEARLIDHEIRLVIYDLLLNAASIPSFYSHPTYVDSDALSGIKILTETGAWESVSTITHPQEPLADDGTQIVSMEGNLTSLSVFAPFDISVAGIDDSNTSDSGTSDTLTGGTGGSGDRGGTGDDSTTDDALADGSSGRAGATDSSESEGLLNAKASRALSEVWVDFAFLGDEFGTEDRPFNSFAEALAVVDIGGVIMAKAGATNETPTFAQAVTVNAVGGPVQAGDPSATQLPGLEGAVIAAFDSTRSFPNFDLLLGPEFPMLRQNLSDAGASIIEISTLDSDSLDGVDIFFSGLHIAGDPATAAEQNALVAFVEAGGGLIAFTERIGFANNNNPITSPFGVTGVGSDRDDLTTITQLAHPVMNGRFGTVDNAGNIYDPNSPGGFEPSPAEVQVLATTVDAEGAILALEKELGKAVFFNDISFITDNFLFDGAGNLPAIMNAFHYVFNVPIFEGVKQDAVLIPKDGIATISTSPTMPPLTAQLTNANGNDSVEWRLKVEYTEGNRAGDPPSLYPGPAETDFVTLTGIQTWNIGSAFGSDFVGGECTLVYKLDGGPEVQFPFKIQGLNPTQATVRAELPSLRHHLIAWKEGRFQQFQTLADFTATWTEGPLSVLRSGDNGFGIMQLTSGTIPKNQLWNWKDNVNEGESRADAFTASALIYNDQVQQGLPWDSDTGFEDDGPPFEGTAFPNATEFTQAELDLETWARYNSGLRYHNWQDEPPMWVRRPTNIPDEESPLGYADELADFRDDIVNNSVFPPLWN